VSGTAGGGQWYDDAVLLQVEDTTVELKDVGLELLVLGGDRLEDFLDGGEGVFEVEAVRLEGGETVGDVGKVAWRISGGRAAVRCQRSSAIKRLATSGTRSQIRSPE